ncbi:hypothetical protein F1728_04525 [Gimesia benthica]|uniref:Uncharacterized protein n=1 Tax=Gimesia benthica TaxID=2608982 RepID=A0A6I6A8V9_9PLAN|nr:hypothetical protein [Gimesia benthica]QGQ22002.1 hypothetical protein F1728_04525 [Gimesia benthica]
MSGSIFRRKEIWVDLFVSTSLSVPVGIVAALLSPFTYLLFKKTEDLQFTVTVIDHLYEYYVPYALTGGFIFSLLFGFATSVYCLVVRRYYASIFALPILAFGAGIFAIRIVLNPTIAAGLTTPFGMMFGPTSAFCTAFSICLYVGIWSYWSVYHDTKIESELNPETD